jgi:hypothetical protein
LDTHISASAYVWRFSIRGRKASQHQLHQIAANKACLSSTHAAAGCLQHRGANRGIARGACRTESPIDALLEVQLDACSTSSRVSLESTCTSASDTPRSSRVSQTLRSCGACKLSEIYLQTEQLLHSLGHRRSAVQAAKMQHPVHYLRSFD